MNNYIGRPPGGPDAELEPIRPDGEPADAALLHVITLLSSTAPVALCSLAAPGLAGLAVFRSRRVEDGRERFRLHLGYFGSVAEAERVLPLVRKTYPTAFVAVAPQAGLGSLDDTGVARFSILKPVETAATEVPAATTVRPLPPPVVRRVTRPAGPPPTVPVLTAAQIVIHAARSVAPPAAPGVAPLMLRAPQRYAVQLVLASERIDLAKLPRLEMFSGYLLYAVETEPDGKRLYGVRLGFYDDVLSARLVAHYVRSEFREVSVVPVSEREVSRAATAAIRLPATRPSRGVPARLVPWPQTALTLTPLARGATL